MFALVILGLIISVLIMLSVFALMFFGVAFDDPEKLRKRREQTPFRDALDQISRVKVDPTDPSSPTYGELVEQGAFKHWVGQKKGVS